MILYVLLCVLLILILGGSYYAYRIAFYSPVKGRNQNIPGRPPKR